MTLANTQPDTISRPRVIYIAGYGRSGSTVLDTAMSKTWVGVESGGELSLQLDAFSRPTTHCSCGRQVSDCTFWQPLYTNTLNGNQSQTAFSRHESRPSHVFGRRINQSSKSWVDWNTRLLRSLSPDGGLHQENWVVDSSKTARKAAFRPDLLEADLGVEIFIVHLVRSPKSVLLSLAKGLNRDLEVGTQTRPRSRLRTITSWVVANAHAYRLSHKLGEQRVRRIEYEQLVADPETTLLEIGAWLRLEEDKERIDVATPHIVTGNRSRFNSPQISRRSSNSWTRTDRALDHAARLLGFAANAVFGG